MGPGYPNSSGTKMGRVTDKYMEVGYGDGEGKTRLDSAPLLYLLLIYY